MIWLLWKIGKTWGARFLAVDQTMEDPKSGQFAGGKLWSLRWKSIKVWWFFDGGFNSFFVPLPMMLPIPSLHYALPLRQSMAGFKLKMFFIFPTGHSLLAESIFFFGGGGGSSSKNLTCTTPMDRFQARRGNENLRSRRHCEWLAAFQRHRRNWVGCRLRKWALAP